LFALVVEPIAISRRPPAGLIDSTMPSDSSGLHLPVRIYWPKPEMKMMHTTFVGFPSAARQVKCHGTKVAQTPE
jgi:hypothetical protein